MTLDPAARILRSESPLLRNGPWKEVAFEAGYGLMPAFQRAGPRKSSPELAGREDELARLEDALAGARDGAFRVVLVRGEAGLGKTRLIDELVKRAGLNVSVIRWQAAHSQSSPASSSGGVESLLRTPSVGRDSEGTTLLAVEDVQDSDEALRDLLRQIARLRPPGLMVVISLRPEAIAARGGIARFLAEVARVPNFDSISLTPLSANETSLQLQGILGMPPRAEIARSLHERSGGNPFLTEELALAGNSDALPAELADALLQEFTRLSPTTQKVLRIASVLGQSFDQRLLVRSAAVAIEKVESALREAASAHLVVPDQPADGKHRFRLPLMHEAVYSNMLASERWRAHARVADALERSPELEPDGTSRLGLIAIHSLAAGDRQRALRFSVDAGTSAERGFAYREALRHFQRAVDLIESGLPIDDLALDASGLYEHAATAAGLVLDADQAVAFCRSALMLPEVASDPIRTGLVHERLGYYYWLQGSHGESRISAAKAVQLIPPAPPSVARARALAGLAMVLMVSEDRAAIPTARAAIREARKVGAHREEASARDDLGSALYFAAQGEKGLNQIRKAIRIATDHGYQDEAVRASINLSWILISDGQYREAAAVGTTAYEVATRNGLQSAYGLGLLDNLIEARLNLGEWDAVEELVGRAFTYLDTELPGHSLIAMRLLRTRGLVALLRGEFDAARADIEKSADASSESQLPVDVVQSAKAAALLATWMDAYEESRRQIDGGRAIGDGEMSERLRLRHVGLWAEADRLRRIGRRARGTQLIDGASRANALLEEAQRIVNNVSLRPHTSRLLRLCEAEHRRFQAEMGMSGWLYVAAEWESLAVEFLENGQRYDAALAYWRAGEAEIRTRGQRSQGRDHLKQSLDLALTLGAQPLVAAVRRLADRARVTLEADAHQRGEGELTRREIDVLALVATGMTNRQIAASLFISEKTAGLHVSNLLAKLGAANRTEAVVIGTRLGLVDRSGPVQS